LDSNTEGFESTGFDIPLVGIPSHRLICLQNFVKTKLPIFLWCRHIINVTSCCEHTLLVPKQNGMTPHFSDFIVCNNSYFAKNQLKYH